MKTQTVKYTLREIQAEEKIVMSPAGSNIMIECRTPHFARYIVPRSAVHQGEHTVRTIEEWLATFAAADVTPASAK